MSIACKEPWQSLVCGCAGSTIADAACMPLDVVKVKLQLSASGMLGEKYTGVLDCVKKVVKTQGMRGLYAGLSPALLRSSTYGTTRIALYEPFKQTFAGDVPKSEMKVHHRLLAGLFSGAIASGMFNPTDVIKIRMQGDRTGTKYPTLVKTAKSVVSEEGPMALYQGVAPCVLRASMCACVELCTYDEAKLSLIRSPVWPFADSLPTHVMAATFAGFFATLFSHPMDLVKARLMNQAKNEKIYSGIADCFKKSIARDGLASLYAGFWPSFGRIGPHTMYVLYRLFPCR